MIFTGMTPPMLISSLRDPSWRKALMKSVRARLLATNSSPVRFGVLNLREMSLV